MIKKLLNAASWLSIGVLLVFTLRRWLLTLFALVPTKAITQNSAFVPPDVLLLVPLRNEAASLPGLLSALDRLAYPSNKLSVVLIDDGSTDGSRALIQAWAKHRENRHALPLARNIGKAAALNAALAKFPRGEIVAIYDADERPQPDALRRLVAHFADARVGGVSGRRAISNALVSPAASYTTFEGLVHQLVTMQAKDRLDLAPALLGANCAYRRTALAEVGHFKPGALLEDSDLTLKLARTGWQVRFEPASVSYHQVPETISGYWRQHTRWARGFNEVARDQAGAVLFDRQLSLALRLELLIFSLGYLDRLALLSSTLLVIANRAARRRLLAMLLLSLLTPLFQIIIALAVSREPATLWRRLAWLPFFFGLDVAMAITGIGAALVQKPQIWEERKMRR